MLMVIEGLGGRERDRATWSDRCLRYICPRTGPKATTTVFVSHVPRTFAGPIRTSFPDWEGIWHRGRSIEPCTVSTSCYRAATIASSSALTFCNMDGTCPGLSLPWPPRKYLPDVPTKVLPTLPRSYRASRHQAP